MALDKKIINTDFCVVGGGLAGINAAITAARLGVSVVLIHERPVYGGNASGEIRMWACGTRDLYYRETGLSEEINLETFFYNPTRNFALWDATLYNKVHEQENLTSLLNCVCFDAHTENDTIKFVTAYQTTTQTFYEVHAKYFSDCSGDSILAPLSGAEFMIGRESPSDYNEPIRTHQEKDDKTMGNSCLIQARKTNRKVPFRAPSWAEKVSVEKLKSKNVDLYCPTENFWYIELGGVLDTIKDAETLNKRLVALCLGVWDTIKNSGEFDADYFELEFIGFLAAKRESRRMTGDYVLTANDILDAKIFPDTIAYGGWPIDDHFPEGFDGNKSNYCISVSKSYGIPYRCLYSKNITNLFFAGRNISATHLAMSSARVMGTCSIIGQAVGVAAHVACKYGVTPRDVGERIGEVQQLLLLHDCFIPGVKRTVSDLCKSATLFNATETVRNGNDRNFSDQINCENTPNGTPLGYTFDTPTFVNAVKLVFDSDLRRETYDIDDGEKYRAMRCNVFDDSPFIGMPVTLAKSFSVTLTYANGTERVIYSDNENKKRNLIIPVKETLTKLTLTVFENWGGTNKTNIFTFEII